MIENLISKTIINRDFMVVDRIDSLPLNDSSFSPSIREQIHHDCGIMMRKMHEITGNQFGRLSDTVAGNGYSNWYDAIFDEFLKVFRTARPYNIFSTSIEDAALSYVQAQKHLLDRIVTPRLAHCDLWDGNILVREQHGQDELCAIIDGDRAFWGDVALDISRVWGENRAFLSGYGEIVSEFSPDEIRKKRNVYSIMLDLTDAYVWIVEYNNPQAYEHTRDSAMKVLGLL